MANSRSPTALDRFGSSVAVSGDIAVAGAYNDDPGGVSNAGTAYVFDATTGALTATLNNPSPNASDHFGWSVAVSGNIAVVGAPLDDPGGVNGAGTAYVFNAATGALVSTLNNPAPTAGDNFGGAVAVSGGFAVVGAIYDDPGGVTDAGTAYVFDTVTGALLATLSKPSPNPGDQFGYSLAVSGGIAVVGAAYDDPGGVTNAGTAYVFNVMTGMLLTTLNNPEPTAGDIFGFAVGISDAVAVVGAVYEAPAGVPEAGTAYVFDAMTGAHLATLDNPEPAAYDHFAYSVAVSGDLAVVGANWDDPGGVTDTGAAYVFTCSAFVPTPTPMPSPTATPTPAPTATPSPTAAPPSPSPTASPCFPGDADNSCGLVDANDFIAVQANFGADNGVGGPGDADCSGSFVDANDFIAVQANFGADCG